MTEKTKIELQYPIDISGAKVSVLHLRRPKARDLEAMDRQGGGNVGRTVGLISALAELTPEQVRELDAADFNRISEVVSGFLSPALPSAT
jgi:hypothetical protein